MERGVAREERAGEDEEDEEEGMEADYEGTLHTDVSYSNPPLCHVASYWFVL